MRCLLSLLQCGGGGGGSKIQQQRCREYQAPTIIKVNFSLILIDISSMLELFQSIMFRGPILMWTQRRRSKSIRIKIVQCVRRRGKEAREQVLVALIRILVINLLSEVKLC